MHLLYYYLYIYIVAVSSSQYMYRLATYILQLLKNYYPLGAPDPPPGGKKYNIHYYTFILPLEIYGFGGE